MSFSGTRKRARVEYADGAIFEGPTNRRHQAEGVGVFTAAEGELKWEGTFRDGVLEGEGQETTADYTFTGCFVSGTKHGAGTMVFRSCGLRIEGRWKGGALHGKKSVVVFPDGRLRMTCHFEEGEFVRGTTEEGTTWEAQGDFPGRLPLQCDPYELHYVVEGQSTIAGAGQGLFAKRAVAAGVIVCYYNGCLVEHTVVDNRSWRYNSNTISLDDEFCLDVPLSHASSKHYCATLGHKVNSSRLLCNCEYAPAFHPFWGAIKSVRTLGPISAGEELFTFYDYRNERRPPAWTKE